MTLFRSCRSSHQEESISSSARNKEARRFSWSRSHPYSRGVLLNVAYSPPCKGGVAARSRKMTRSFVCPRRRGGRPHRLIHLEISLPNDHPVRSFQWMLRDIFLVSRTPLLCKEFTM